MDTGVLIHAADRREYHSDCLARDARWTTELTRYPNCNNHYDIVRSGSYTRARETFVVCEVELFRTVGTSYQ